MCLADICTFPSSQLNQLIPALYHVSSPADIIWVRHCKQPMTTHLVASYALISLVQHFTEWTTNVTKIGTCLEYVLFWWCSTEDSIGHVTRDKDKRGYVYLAGVT